MPDVTATDKYVDFYFGADQSVAEINTLEISQVSFSQVWRLQNHYRHGLWARLETGERVFWQYVPVAIKALEERGNLDYGIAVTLGDLGEILPDEIERARAAGTMRSDPPTVIQRTYRSDDLEAPMFGPIVLEAREVGRIDIGAQFNATAPELNVSKTGEAYESDRFVMLLGLL